MILSHSGWRGIFAASGGEEDRTGEISEKHSIIVAAAAVVFAEYIRGLSDGSNEPLVLLGTDTRPTGTAIADVITRVLSVYGCRVRYAGIVAAPEIMAWARSFSRINCGFIYVSASHNPIGHNGLKFGLNDGGVLPARETAKLIANFHSLINDQKIIAGLAALINENRSNCKGNRGNYVDENIAKKEAYNAYLNFAGEVAFGGCNTTCNTSIDTCITERNTASIADLFKKGIAERPLGICCDFNGSGRSVSIDREFFEELGIQFMAINDIPGNIAHRIVPEGDALEPCRVFLEEQHRINPAFMLGYVPDCDGDRGNLVIWDDSINKARTLEAQEVFAIACVAEIAQLVKTGVSGNIAIAVNDPTSLRIDSIAEAFGAKVFRAEVGEANVVGLARALRDQGFIVRILGEGSAGGNITHPSSVRDPLHTVMALAKLLSIRSNGNEQGLFELWCTASGQKEKYHADFTLSDIIASLPRFISTGAYTPEALLQVTCKDHGALKSRYQQIFLCEWEDQKEELKTNFGIYHWEAAAYNGMSEKKGIVDFGEAGRGGLKICFYNANGRAIASIWMRGSATEPVFRVMADAQSTSLERRLIEWQRRMTLEADRT